MSNPFVQRGGRWVLGQTMLMLAVLVLSILFPSEGASRWLPGCGAALFAAGCGCGTAGLAALGWNVTPFPKPTANARLVQRGIYRRVRHPLHTAVFCGFVGWALLWQSWPAWTRRRPESIRGKPVLAYGGPESGITIRL